MWSEEDEKNMRKILSATDDATSEWIQKNLRHL